MNAVVSHAPMFAPGALLAGRYRLEILLGSGAMADVWRASDQTSNREVALKLLRAQLGSHEEAERRFERECAVLSALSHPAIVRIESYGQLESGTVYLVMELLEGETLGARMRRGRMDPIELAPILTGICAGLQAAHSRHIVHRDLKPENIFLVPDPARGEGAPPFVKLLDFGVSKVFDGDRLTYTGEILGTPRYMSPEQLGAEPEIDARVDLYALGVILYEALARNPPFHSTSPTDLLVAILHGKVVPLRSYRPDLSPALEAVIMRAMSRAREARYRSAAELADAFLDASGVTLRHISRGPLPRTVALGGGTLQAPVVPDGQLRLTHEPPEARPVLRPGTFSAFETGPPSTQPRESHFESAHEPRLDLQRGRDSDPPPESARESRVGSPHEHSGRGAAAFAARSPLDSGFVSERSSIVGAADSSYGRGSRVSSVVFDGPSVLAPTRPSRARWSGFGLALVGLVAGALAATVVIGALSWSSRGVAPSARSGLDSSANGAPSGSAISREAAVSAASDSNSTDDSDSASESEAEADAASPDTDESSGQVDTEGPRDPGDAPAQGSAVMAAGIDPPGIAPVRAPPRPPRRRSFRRSDAPAEPSPALARAPVSVPNEDPLMTATQALAGHRPERCVAILDAALSSGRATPALYRRRADCYLAMGQSSSAIRDYQFFCRLAPSSHPELSAVRDRVAEMGQSCPGR